MKTAQINTMATTFERTLEITIAMHLFKRVLETLEFIPQIFQRVIIQMINIE